MLFLLYLYRHVLLTGFPECAGLWAFKDGDGIDGYSWTPDRVRERTIMV
jgi:hypothetical protein